MSSFISNLIDRSIAPATDIQPRLRGKFEQAAAPSESFSVNEEIASSGASQSADETTTPPQRTELVRRTHVTKFIEERSEEISPSIKQKPSQKDTEQSVPDAKPERPSRFQPSYNVIVQAPEQDSSETNITNIYQQSKVVEHVIDPNNENKQQQASTPQPDVSSSTIITKEVYKPLPVVKPIANNTFRVEPQQKLQPKQSPAASFIQRQTAKPEPSRTINISIGRVEVRVSQPAAAAAKPKKEGIPIMGLDEYLQQRNQRGQ